MNKILFLSLALITTSATFAQQKTDSLGGGKSPNLILSIWLFYGTPNVFQVFNRKQTV